MPWKKNWLPFAEARDIVASMGFRSYREFEQWKDRPSNIPSNPREAYRDDWVGREYWIGIGPAKESSRPRERADFLPFEEARAVAQELLQKYGITNQSGWFVFAKTSDRPSSIPADPSSTYRGKGWINWPDWLGRKPARASGREKALPFSEAREFARTLGLKHSKDWYTWAETDARPSDIPYSPATRYRDEGWIGWGDFLGFHSRWTHLGIVSFLDSLQPCIEHLNELDLYLILSRNGMLRRDARQRAARLLRGLIHFRSKGELEEAKQQVAAELDAEQEPGDSREAADEVPDEIPPEELTQDDGSSLRPLDILESLKTVDRVVELRVTEDPDVLDFMVDERVSMLWQEAMVSGEQAVTDQLATLPDGEYATTIRDRFTEQLQKVKALPVPEGYRIVDAKGDAVELSLMQRLTAHRLLHEKRLGNWSGVGAGKTNAAVFASAVVDARMTLILAANATVRGWKATIRRAFAEDAIHVHDQKPIEFCFQAGKRNFLVVNYESFQQEWTAEFVRRVIQQAPIDFIVFDEVHFARQRHQAESQMSERRKQVNALIRSAVAKNPELRILAMSATPVVNNLREAIKVLELIFPERDFSEIPVGSSIANAIRIHFLLRQHGIRYVPRYDLQLEKRAVAIDGQPWFDRLAGLRPRDILQMEQTLLEPKLRQLADFVRRGTLIYTHYVDDIVEPLTNGVQQLGLRVRHFTGRERSAIEEFVRDYRSNRADVLIGSAPVGTGVDGLQFVLDRLIFITLPWSHAEYEQIVGRLWRQGSAFDKVEVIIPQVTLREERAGQWSWDDLRLRCIEYKQTLADAALDGVIPRGGLPSREEMQRRSLDALKLWSRNVALGTPQTASDPTLATPPSSEPNPMPAV